MELSQVIARLYDSYKSNNELSFDDLRIAWERCEDAPKMLDVAGRLDIDKTLLVQIACKCARLVLHLVSEGEDRPRLAIEAAEKWIEMPSRENGNAAADAAADAAACTADYDAAHAASYAASYAAATANAAAYDAADAAYYASSYASYAANTAYYSGDATIKKKFAEIVRKYIPFELIKLAVIFN